MEKNNTSLHCKRVRPRDILIKTAVYFSAAVTTGVLVFILAHILINGLPHITWDFLTGPYDPSAGGSKGVLPMIINTLYTVVLTLLMGVPIGVGAAVYLTQYAKQGRLVRIIRFATETLSGIPSIIFGLFGLALFVEMFHIGLTLLSASLTLTICILPTIIRTTEEALLAVPESYKEGALALGASRLRVVLGIVVPSAMPGILTAVILAVGRIVGETAAILGLVNRAGYGMPTSIFGHITDSGNAGRTLSLHLYTAASNANDPRWVLYATASVLLILVFIINRLAALTARMLKKDRGN